MNSWEQAQRTYDGCTANDKKQFAISLAREYAEERYNHDPDSAHDDWRQAFEPGEFVALVEQHSSVNQHKILVGLIHCFVGKGDVSLLWYQNVSGSFYKMELTGGQWVESQDSLVPVVLRPAKNKLNK